MKDITEDIILPLLPRRPAEAHKGTFGKGLLVCGSARYRGAAALCAEGALRTGIGLLTLAAPECVIQSVATLIPECSYFPTDAAQQHFADKTYPGDALLEIVRELKGKTALGIGCGLAEGAYTNALVQAVLQACTVPAVIDATGLVSLRGREYLLTELPVIPVLTPHPGELASLMRSSTSEILTEPEKCAASYAEKTHAVVVLKLHRTVIAVPGGTVWRNTTGGSGLSRGGSGDFLTGMITSYLAQGLSPEQAAVLAVYMHGKAADICAEKLSLTGMLPHELPLGLQSLYLEYGI